MEETTDHFLTGSKIKKVVVRDDQKAGESNSLNYESQDKLNRRIEWYGDNTRPQGC